MDLYIYIDPFSFLVDSSNSKDSSGLSFSEWNSFMSRWLANPGSRHDLLSFMSPFTSVNLFAATGHEGGTGVKVPSVIMCNDCPES